MLQKSGRLVLWEAMFILELHSAETQEEKSNETFTGKCDKMQKTMLYYQYRRELLSYFGIITIRKISLLIL